MHVEPSSEAQATIKRVLDSLPAEQATVNQTAYSPVAERPIFVSIETKTIQSSEEAAKAQLGMWADAGNRRAECLMEITKPRGLRQGEHPTRTQLAAPLLLISGHNWDLYWAIDRGDKIDALRYRQHLGTTKTIGDIYMLLASVRSLAAWGVDVFYPWWEQDVLHVAAASM